MSHLNNKAIKQKIFQASQLVTVGSVYFHYKNPKSKYMVKHLAISEKTEQPVVIYQNLSDPQLIWVRDIDDFNATVSTPDGLKKRFTII